MTDSINTNGKYILKKFLRIKYQRNLYNNLFNNYSNDNTFSVIKKVCKQFTNNKCQLIFGELVVNIFYSLLEKWKNNNNKELEGRFYINMIKPPINIKPLERSVLFNINEAHIDKINDLMLKLQDNSWGPFVYANLAFNVFELIRNNTNIK